MAKRPKPFPVPTAADVVLCRFPEDLWRPQVGPKARPAIVLKVFAPADAKSPAQVIVCYGTSNVSRIYPHDLLIARTLGDQFSRTGLTCDTKFDMRHTVTLPYTDEWFQIPRTPQFGGTPKLGELHALTVPSLRSALNKVRR